MTFDVRLDSLAMGTAFRLGCVTYKKTTSCKGTEIKCEIFLGGRFQNEEPMLKWIEKNTLVTVDSECKKPH